MSGPEGVEGVSAVAKTERPLRKWEYFSAPPKTPTLKDPKNFTLIGTEKSLNQNTSNTIAVVLGVMTGVAGGIMRDLLTGEIPLV